MDDNPQHIGTGISREWHHDGQIVAYTVKSISTSTLEAWNKDILAILEGWPKNQPLRILENIDFYKGDPGFKLKVIGYKCAGCGLVVSEDSREKEKIGGKDAKKIAKAACPKCKKPFGNLPQYVLDVPAAAQ